MGLFLWDSQPSKIFVGNTSISKVFLWDTKIRPTIPPYLCFTANTAGSTVALNKNDFPTVVNLETSADWTTWTDYTIWNTITLSNVGDKVYWRNKSETTTRFSISTSKYYNFTMTGSINASWDITTLLNKNGTDALNWDYCYFELFFWCTSLVTAPSLPATILSHACYLDMFRWCTNLTTAPSLPATTLATSCYQTMFYWCTNLATIPKLPATTLANDCYFFMFYLCGEIKLSTTQTWEYQTPYRIPTTWTWTTARDALDYMFSDTWWTFTWTPSINTTYYTSNTVV